MASCSSCADVSSGNLTTGGSCDFVLGEQPGGSGQIVQSAGTVTLGKILFVGNNATGTSSYTLTGEYAKGYSAKLLDNGSRCRISRSGFVILVR